MNDRQLKTKWAQLNWRSRIAYLSIVFVLLFIPFVRIVLETLFGVELNSFRIIVIAWGFSVLANLIAVERGLVYLFSYFPQLSISQFYYPIAVMSNFQVMGDNYH